MNSSNDALCRTAVIIVAAGEGRRLPGDRPKAYQMLQGEPILIKTIRSVLQHNEKYQIIVAHHPEHLEWLNPILLEYPSMISVEGGVRRQDSVYNALKKIEHSGFKYVLIHDAARPFVEVELLERVAAALQHHVAVIPVMPVTDTIKRVVEEDVRETPDRSELFAAQTPQGFEYKTILDLHRQFKGRNATDDAMLAEWAGIPVKTVAGSFKNRKITTPEDIIMAEQSLNIMNLRAGMGFDVHQLVAEGASGTIKLCGIEVPCAARLEGHSDGDVGLHALTDAIFGALAVGDLGMHFPSDDMQWRGADSSEFLKYASNLMLKHKAILINADITLIANTPKVSPYRDAMRQRIASIMEVDIARISVKATTTDGLGFTGRGEGIAAQAIVNLMIDN